MTSHPKYSQEERNVDIVTTTQTTVITTTVATWNPGNLDVTTTVIVIVILIVTFALVLFFKYQIVTANYKRWTKILRRARRVGEDEEGNGPRNEIWFQPPPAYDIALTMEAPCTYCSENGIQADPSDTKCKCKRQKDVIDKVEDKHNETPTISIVTETDGDRTGEDNDSISTIDTSNSDGISTTTTASTMTTTTTVVSNTEPFLILEHVQRMSRDNNASFSRLPTYQEYQEEFPEDIYVAS